MPVLVKPVPHLVGVCPGIGHWATVSGRVVSTDPVADHLDEAGIVAVMVRRRLRTIRCGLHPDGIVYRAGAHRAPRTATASQLS